jgi:hypothetical protein
MEHSSCYAVASVLLARLALILTIRAPSCPETNVRDRMTSCLAFLQGCRRGAIPLRVKRPVVVMIFRLSDHARSTIARLDLNPRRPVAAVD